jgi:hypothetical protein
VIVFDDVQFDAVRRAITAARRLGLLPPGQIRVANVAVCGIAQAGGLRRYLLPRLHPGAVTDTAEGREHRVYGSCDRQAGVAQERVGQMRRPADPVDAPVRLLDHLGEGSAT